VLVVVLGVVMCCTVFMLSGLVLSAFDVLSDGRVLHGVHVVRTGVVSP
jgi:hypothetical protein